MRSDDRYAVPLCHPCHMQLHACGDEELWFAMNGVDVDIWLAEDWEAHGD